jgi:hypothetical protein
MSAFPNRVEIGLVGRRAPDRVSARLSFGARDDERLVLLAFRAARGSMLRLPEPSQGLKYILSDPPIGRRDVIVPPKDSTFLNALAAADAVVAKPGYGILGDVGLNGLRLLYTDRKGFPEHPFLVEWLQHRPGCARIDPQDLAGGDWLPQVRALLEQPTPVAETEQASEAAAAHILARLS